MNAAIDRLLKDDGAAGWEAFLGDLVRLGALAEKRLTPSRKGRTAGAEDGRSKG